MRSFRSLLATVAGPAACRAMCLLALAVPAFAQDTATTVIQPENVRMDVAQVMRVRPIFQTLRATRMEPRCAQAKDDPKVLSRLVGAVKGVLAREEDAPADPGDCELVPVQREFRRPIAYDVDYVYRGMKYRSRLPYDPGNRLRVRVSVMPHVPVAPDH
jgi:uncharacterized protein YcfJ